MAIWQFDIALVPDSALAADPDLFVHSVTPDGIETSAWWASAPAPGNLDSQISEILPRSDSWSEELSVWGAEDGHRIDLWRDGEAIESIKVRIDARKPATKFIESVCAFAKSMQCRFYGYNAHAEIDSTPAALLAALRESDATKFVRDPRGFLSEIADRADP